jgi:hypothetical protein
MPRNRLGAAICALSLLLPAVAAGQIEITAGGESATLGGDVKPLRAIRITLSGEMRLDGVYRDDDYFDAALGDAITGAPGSALGWDGSSTPSNGGDSFLMPWISIDIDTQLSQGVNALLTLETPFNEFVDNVGGSGSGRSLDVEQAYVRWMGAFVPDLTLVVGIQEYVVDFAGNGDPFLVDVSRSENAFSNPTAAADFGTPQSPSSGSPSSQEGAGALGEIQLGDAELDLFYFVLEETFRLEEDSAFFGAVLDYGFETRDWNGTLGILFVDMQNDPSSDVFTAGGGGHVETASGGLKFYAEGYGQFGRYLNHLSGFGRITQKRSFGAFGGIRYVIPGLDEMRPWIDASYWEVSGDDQGNDGENGSFVSLEGNNDTIVIEDSYYGLDIDQNYRAVKAKGGLNLTEDWSVEALYAYFELQDNSNGTSSNQTGHDKLGEEVDLTVHFRATDYLNFRLGTGWLLDPVALGMRSTINVTVLSAEVRF